MQKFRQNLLWIVMGLLCLVIFMLPYFILRDNYYVTIHDHLDNTIAHMEYIKRFHLLTTNKGILPILCGIPRAIFNYASPLSLRCIFFVLLPLSGYIIVQTLFVKVSAYLGMYFLLAGYILKNKNRVLIFALSLSFALIPFYIDYSLSSAGIPLILYAFLNLYNKKHLIISYIIIAFVSFNSNLELSGFFIGVLLFLYVIGLWVRNKSIKVIIRPILGLILMCGIYVLSNWNTILSLFISTEFISHRIEFANDTSLLSYMYIYIHYVLECQYHSGCFMALPLLVVSWGVVCEKRKNLSHVLRESAIFWLLVSFLMLLGILLRYTPFQIFNSIQFDRMYFIYPAATFILLGAALNEIKTNLHYLGIVVLCIVCLLCAQSYDSEYHRNLKLLMGKSIAQPTLQQFYDQQLFSEIRRDLNVRNDYKTKVVSLGLFPTIAEFNGFYTLDSYFDNYPVVYKHKFRKVIAKELAKSEELRKYYDDWGSRCYLFSSEIERNFYYCKKDNKKVHNLEINTCFLKQMGCKYILSAVEIENYQQNELQYIQNYSLPNSFWRIWVYKI